MDIVNVTRDDPIQDDHLRVAVMLFGPLDENNLKTKKKEEQQQQHSNGTYFKFIKELIKLLLVFIFIYPACSSIFNLILPFPKLGSMYFYIIKSLLLLFLLFLLDFVFQKMEKMSI